jgi:PAS domain S-box-containing protein
MRPAEGLRRVPLLTSTPVTWSGAKSWTDFLDLLGDAVLVLDSQARIVFANTAALRLVPCEVGMALRELEGVFGAEAVRWLAQAAAAGAVRTAPPRFGLVGGRNASVVWRRLDARHSALRLLPDVAAPAAATPAPFPAHGATADAIRLFWDSPFPATLQGSDFRLVDVNPAFLDFSGYTRAQLIGRDPLELMPESARAAGTETRRQLQASGGRTDVAALAEGWFVDAGGRERSYRAARRVVVDDHGRPAFLALLQDTTAERIARERADRSVRELDDWFDLSPSGMVLFDRSGLLVRANPAFAALLGGVPVHLRDAAPALQQLLGWEGDAPSERLQPGSAPLEGQGWVGVAGGMLRRLRSVVRCHRTAGGQSRYMAVIEDRSVEEERDLAQLQIGALMDTAGVGLATFQESSGWVRQPALAATSGGAGAGASTAALQSISREIVAPESLAEYERLQVALRQAQRAEVRYAIEHAELGRRWLLTRVEPGTLASGKRTTSVVTLDITEQQHSRQRSEQLLREMTTILESSTAGIAYLRGDALVRCNRRFETMLGLATGVPPGSRVAQLFGRHVEAVEAGLASLRSLEAGAVHETEFELDDPAGGDEPRWLSLSVRRVATGMDPLESIAVLSDVTRIKSQQRELEILARDRELMFSLSEVGIAFVRDGRIQRANEAMAELTGWSVDELSTLELAALFLDADDFARHWSVGERDLRLHGRWSGERQLRRRDGGVIWVQASKRLVNRGRPQGGIIASYVDVDARHRAERALALQADRTRSILDSVLVGIVNVGPNGIEWMNRSAQRMFGGSLAEFVGQPLATVATPEPDHPFRNTRVRDQLAEGQSETFECRVCARDGREFWIVGNAVATGGEAAGRQLTYALLDIERRRQAEARMSEAQSALQQVIAAAPLAIALLDAHSLKVIQANEVAARALGNAAGRLGGRAPEDLFEPDVAVARRRDMQEALAGQGVTTREYRVEADADAPARVWDARYVPIAAAPGHPPDQLLLVATDVTEQRAAQEARLEAAIAQREMLVKEVHHRIKNNLQGVAGLMQQIAERKPEVAPAIAEVVGQVQAIAQVYGLQVGAEGPLRVAAIVEAIVGSVQRNFGLAIRRRAQGPCLDAWALPEAEAIPVALTLNELLTNAIKHSRGGGGADVDCELTCDEAGVRVMISNPARLPPGFDLGGIPGGVSGLGLVRALLPRRHASLGIEQRGARVAATVLLRPPVVRRPDAERGNADNSARRMAPQR